MFHPVPDPSFPGEPALPRLGAALADALAAVRVALELLGSTDAVPREEVIALARGASRKAEAYREPLAALARAHSMEVAPGASEACTVLRRALAASEKDDRCAGARAECPRGKLFPVALSVPVLSELFGAWWRGARAVLEDPGSLVVETGSGVVRVHATGRLAVSPECLAIACGDRGADRLAAVPLPPGAWYLAVAGVLARRAGGDVRATVAGPELVLPAYPGP